MTWQQSVVVVYFAVGALLAFALIGKERSSQYEAGPAFVGLVLSAFLIWCVVA